jgi:hypothetical protein
MEHLLAEIRTNELKTDSLTSLMDVNREKSDVDLMEMKAEMMALMKADLEEMEATVETNQEEVNAMG